MNAFELCPLTQRGRIRKFHLDDSLIRRFEREATLSSSQRSVNRLSWNSTGTLLLSGSDDCKLALFPFPDYDRPALSVATLHSANIFGVRFLPESGDRTLVSSAMDGTVCVHRLDTSPSQQLLRQSQTQSFGAETNAESAPTSVEAQSRSELVCSHGGRVKDVEVEEGVPHLIWSSGEDGTLRQTDLRESKTDVDSSNVLVSVRYPSGARQVALKSIDINKVRSYQIAVACGDAFIRLYDRRKLTLGTMKNNYPEPLMMLAPPHMTRYTEKHNCHSSCVNFANKGDKIVCLYNLDHCYTFDITSEGTRACTYYRPTAYESCGLSTRNDTGLSHHKRHGTPQTLLTTRSNCTEDGRDTIWSMNEAIFNDPGNVSHYITRAKLYLERHVNGDGSFALRDCDHAIWLNPECREAHFLRCKALRTCSMPSTALFFLEQFKTRFPIEDDSGRVLELREELDKDFESKRRLQENQYSTSDSEEEDDGHLRCKQTTNQEVQEDAWFHYYQGDTFGGCDQRQDPGGVWWNSQGGQRLLMQFVGQINSRTDFKECTFFGQDDSHIVCGSDDGQVYIYNADSGRLVNVFRADNRVVNSVQGHPTLPCLATSGADSTVKLWSPGEAFVDHERIERVLEGNQTRLRSGPVMASHIIAINNFFDDVDWIIRSDTPDEDDTQRSNQCRLN